MPIVVTDPAPSTPFGWGHLVDLITNTPGPFLPPLTWDLTMMDTDLNRTWGEAEIGVIDPHVPTQAKFLPDPHVVLPFQNAFQQGGDARLRVRLISNGAVAEELVVPVKLDVLGWLNEQATKQAAGGALSSTQAQQLEETHASTFPTISMDSLTLLEISSGPQGGVVSSNLPGWIWGVIVRMVAVPPEWRVDTADGNYWTRSLAVVRIYRGADLWKRVPVHTSSKIITFVDEGLTAAIATTIPLHWLLQVSVQVSFADGAVGQVFLMKQP